MSEEKSPDLRVQRTRSVNKLVNRKNSIGTLEKIHIPSPSSRRSSTTSASGASNEIRRYSLKERRVQEVSDMGGGEYTLGIDLGTTSVKVCLVNVSDQSISDLHTKESSAYTPSDADNGDQQNPSRIYSALYACLAKVPKDKLKRVKRIAFSGQMHGVVFWKAKQAWTAHDNGEKEDKFEIHGDGVSSLYTWQDNRCDTDFIESLPQPDSHLKLATGYGCATIFWFLKNRPSFLSNWDSCGTVMDFVVAMITRNSDRPVMSTHNAASWGYFNTVTSAWNTDILEQQGFPVNLLPRVVSPATDVGQLGDRWFDIPEGTPVSVALGDLQCSVMSTLENATTDVVMNISTSAQMAFVMPKGFDPKDIHSNSHPNTIEFLPYLDGHYIAAAAALTGGNALAAFVKMLQRWVVDLGLSIPQSKIWEKTLALGIAAEPTLSPAGDENAQGAPSNPPSPLHGANGCGNFNDAELMRIIPRLFGERHLPDERASASNIRPDNLSLGKVTRSICAGIATNMAEMMPPEMIHQAGMKRIVGSGGSLSRNPILKSQMQEVYNLPVDFAAKANACIGAALAVQTNQDIA